MKKTILLLGLMLSAIMSGYALTAEEIVGKWESNNIAQEETPEMPISGNTKVTYVFSEDQKADAKYDINMSIEIDRGVFVDIFMNVTAKGNYSVAGDSITVTKDESTVKINLSKDDIRIRGKEIEDQNMIMSIQDGIYQQFSMMTEQMAPEYATADVLNNVVFTEKKIICVVEDQMVTFKRKKK